MSGLDASFLYFETRAQLLHVCGLIEIDPGTMPGGYSFEALRAEMDRRVAGMPAFRRKLHDSVINVDHPVWVEAEDFNVDHHLHRIGLPSPGTDEELATLCGRLASLPIDRSMPLWEMFVIEGLANGRVAIFTKMHHATVDGVSGANMMSQLCTLPPDDPSLDEELVKQNAGGVSSLELAVGGVFSRLTIPLKVVSLLPGTIKVLPSWINRARKGLAMPAPFTAPRTPFNRNITGHRSIAFTSVELDEVKRVKNAFGTTINDVVLAVCASALRSYLDSVGELPEKPLIAMVPMSVHEADHRPGTNRVSGMFMSLATDVDDPVERLELIRDHNLVAKDHNKAIDANLLTDWAQFAAPSVFGSAVRMYSRLRLSERHPVVYNLVISNVPGPNFPLYFLGCRIENMLPMGPVFHGAGLNCTVMSLNGQLHVGFIACSDIVGDLWPLAEHIPQALEEYLAVVEQREATASEPRTRPARKATAKRASTRKPASDRAAARKSTAKAGGTAPSSAAGGSPTTKNAAGTSTARKASADPAGETKQSVRKTPARKAPAKKATPVKATAGETARGGEKTSEGKKAVRKPTSAKPTGSAAGGRAAGSTTERPTRAETAQDTRVPDAQKA